MRAKSVLAVALAGFMTAGASAYVIGGFKGSAPVTLHQPQKPDSVQKENPFSADKLLKSRHFATQWPETAGWTTMVPDTAGNLVLVDSKNAPQLRTFASHLRAERFAKGKLKLVSSPRADVVLNGDVKISKTTADSVPGEQSADIELLPQQDYSLIVNVLTMPDDPGKPESRLEFVPDKDFEGVKVSSRYHEVISAEESRKRVVMTETATGRTVSENIEFSADWMPKSNSLYFTKEGVRDYDLYVMEVPAMRTTRIATAIPDQDVTFSPDEKYLFYYDKVDGAKNEGVMRRYTNPDDRIPGDRDRFYICRYDIENGVAVPLTYGGGTTSICDISRDGSKLLYMSQRQTPDKYPFYRVSLVQMDMNTFATDTIINDADGFVSNAIYSPDATRLFVVGGPDAFDRIGANHDPEPIANNFDNQGFIMTLSDRSVKPVTKDFDPSLEGTPVWNAADNRIYFIGERGFFRDLYQLNPNDGKIVMRGKENLQTVRGFSIGDREDRYAAYWGGSFTDDGVACLLNLKNGKSTLVDDPLKEWLGDTQFGKMEPWKFTASDGTVVDGYMCLPPDFDANKKYPLIVYYYGGTSPSNASFYHLYSPQVFASRDYVVYVLNPSGTTGYGAFMTQYLLTKTDIFHAAISHAGISNVTSYWGEGFWGYSYNSVAAAKSYPWTDPELFTKQGSLFNADKIHTPLLLLHGTVDTNVPIGESIQLFNALKILGRDVEFITVQDENHIISNFNNKLSWHNTIMAWFAKWLQDAPSWWDELYK